MGLLDNIFGSTGDPERDAARNRGLLAAGLQLMQAKGRLFPALGQAGMAGIGASDQYAQQAQAAEARKLQQQMQQMLLQQAQRQAQLEALPGQFYRAPSSPAVDATGGMDTAVENPNNASGPGGFDMPGYIQALMAKSPMQALQLQAAMQKDNTPMIIPKDAVAIGRNGKPVFSNVQADPAKQTKLAQLIAERDALPMGSPLRAAYEEAIKKESTHTPPVQMNNYGSPVAGVDPKTGNPAFAVTDKQGNVKMLTAIAPSKKDMTEGQAKANLFGTRAEGANAIIEKMGAQGVNAPSVAQQLTGGEGWTGTLATALAGPRQQQVDQAQRDFINAVLRRESGAVISPQEALNARKQYFPMPGDSREVIQQKAENRKLAIKGILAEVPGMAQQPAVDNDPLGYRK